MNARERVIAVLEGQKPDMVPIVPKIAFANVIAFDDMKVIDYMTDPKCMAKACIGAAKRFGWDGISFHTDISSEGMALGSIYDRPENSPAILRKYLLHDIGEADKVKIPDPYTTEPMKTVIEAIKIAKKEVGEDYFIIGWTNGPLNVASQLYNLDELLISLIESPDEAKALLEICTQVSCVYAEALVQAGADAVAYGHATASSNVISRSCYEEFALPYEKRLVSAIHKAGAKAITHICGHIEAIIDLIDENGSDVVDFDTVCDIDRLRKKVPDKVYRGNISPSLFAVGQPEEIEKEVKTLLEQQGTSHQFLLGSGCEINLNTSAANLEAFVHAGRKYGKK